MSCNIFLPTTWAVALFSNFLLQNAKDTLLDEINSANSMLLDTFISIATTMEQMGSPLAVVGYWSSSSTLPHHSHQTLHRSLQHLEWYSCHQAYCLFYDTLHKISVILIDFICAVYRHAPEALGPRRLSKKLSYACLWQGWWANEVSSGSLILKR